MSNRGAGKMREWKIVDENRALMGFEVTAFLSAMVTGCDVIRDYQISFSRIQILGVLK